MATKNEIEARLCITFTFSSSNMQTDKLYKTRKCLNHLKSSKIIKEFKVKAFYIITFHLELQWIRKKSDFLVPTRPSSPHRSIKVKVQKKFVNWGIPGNESTFDFAFPCNGHTKYSKIYSGRKIFLLLLILCVKKDNLIKKWIII